MTRKLKCNDAIVTCFLRQSRTCCCCDWVQDQTVWQREHLLSRLDVPRRDQPSAFACDFLWHHLQLIGHISEYKDACQCS